MVAYAEGEECAQAKDDGYDDLDLEIPLVGALELVIPRWILGAMHRHYRIRGRGRWAAWVDSMQFQMMGCVLVQENGLG